MIEILVNILFQQTVRFNAAEALVSEGLPKGLGNSLKLGELGEFRDTGDITPQALLCPWEME